MYRLHGPTIEWWSMVTWRTPTWPSPSLLQVWMNRWAVNGPGVHVKSKKKVLMRLHHAILKCVSIYPVVPMAATIRGASRSSHQRKKRRELNVLTSSTPNPTQCKWWDGTGTRTSSHPLLVMSSLVFALPPPYEWLSRPSTEERWDSISGNTRTYARPDMNEEYLQQAQRLQEVRVLLFLVYSIPSV